MIRKFIAVFVLIFFAASTTAFAEFIPVDGDKTREYLKAGDIIRVEGVGLGPKNCDKQDSFYKIFARQAARMDALRQFVEEIGGVYIEENKNNPKILTARTSHDNKMFELITKHARQVEGRSLENGGYSVTMELKIPDDWVK